ncbi:MAG: 5-(carboxyamino)imidazole ribonucleotide synthase [Pseudomonadota bacterium]
MRPLPAGAVIGILGTGQLARMLALAAARLGLKTHVYGPESDAPAHSVSAAQTTADYDDHVALQQFAGAVDVVTYEFENVPEGTARILAEHTAVHPAAEALRVAQDRLTEKRYLENLGIPVAPFTPIDHADDLAAAIRTGHAPGILKTRRLGYDGKGQSRVRADTDPQATFDEIGGAPAILEGFISFEREVSVIAARDKTGTYCAFDIAENVHRDGILHTSTVPAGIGPETAALAVDMARTLMDGLNYVGVLGLELFHCPGGDGPDLIANEFAPRVHNSGHWTMDACITCQFEQHIRAVAGWPLGDTERHSDVVMTNLIGAEIDQVSGLASSKRIAIHVYGKTDARPGRKMGHVNTLKKRIG